MKTLKKKHPLAIRWFHWINFPVLFLMIWSGLLIYWSNPVYRIGLGSHTLLTFFPERFFQALGIPYHLAKGMSLHFFFMWFFVINGVLYVAYTFISGEWRYLAPNRHSLREAIRVTLHDLHLSKIEPPPRKFNGAQQIAYTTVILMGAGSLVTGIAIYKPVQFAWLTALLGGYQWARWEHFWLAAGYVIFFVIHFLQVVKAGWNNFRAMVTGYEIATMSQSSSEKPNPRVLAKGDVMTNKREERVDEHDLNVERIMRSKSRRSFLVIGGSAAAGVAGWEWLTTRPQAGGLSYPLRRTLEFNEELAESYFKEARLTPTFPREMAGEPRVDGDEGLTAEFDPSTWRLQVMAAGKARTVTLEEIKRLRRVEMTTEHKCIEGWSTIVNWAGARLSDFAAAYNLATRSGTPPDFRNRPRDLVRYVGLETPDGGYYVGLDMPSAMHPQTLLCYEMGGRPLTLAHGAPLRLVTTVKYGIKSIKRIGRITFTDERPRDFWSEQGYDWYTGL